MKDIIKKRGKKHAEVETGGRKVPEAPGQQNPAPVKKKRGRCCFGFLIGCLTPFLILVLFVLWLLSASGIVDVPVGRELFYREPKPTREIVYNPKAAEELSKMLDESGQPKPGDLSRLVITEKGSGMKITEEELSAIILKGQKETFSHFQVAIFADRLEIFGKVIKPPTSFLVSADLIIGEGGKMSIDIFNAQVGAVGIPKGLLGAVEGSINDLLTPKEGEERQEKIGVKAYDKHEGYIVVYFEDENQKTCDTGQKKTKNVKCLPPRSIV